MLLLFLLVFNSATALSADSFEEREVATERVRVLSVVAWPSILLSSDPEATNRSWKLLAPLRYQQRVVAATELLDSYWPSNVTEATALWNDYNKWKILWKVIQSRSDKGVMTEWLTEWFEPDNSFWNYGTVNDLIGLLNFAKFHFGSGSGWLFPDYSKIR